MNTSPKFELWQEIVAGWEKHREKLCLAVAETNGTHTEGDVLMMLLFGKAKLLTSEKSAAVVEVIQYPQMKALNVFLSGGELLDLIEQESVLEDEARKMGCARIEFGGREEWRAAMKDRPDGFSGFGVRGILFYKEVAP